MMAIQKFRRPTAPVSLGAFLIAFFWALSARAEPPYCSLDQFKKAEIKSPVSGLKRVHVFQLGETVLAGLAIGQSNAKSVSELSGSFSSAGVQNDYCTWYVNSGNSEAEKRFVHHLLPHPMTVSPSTEADTYLSTMHDSFELDAPSFQSCIVQNHYLAIGCNGMMHRGPTVFGMLLAYSGCSAEHAENIVDAIWGLNGVDRAVRLSIISRAFDLGNANPESQRAVARALE